MALPETLYPQGNFLNIKANAPTQKDYNIQATKDLVQNLPGGVVKDFLAPAAAATLSLPYDAIQAYGRMEPKSGIMGFKDAFMAENPFSSLVERTIGAAGPLAERFDDVNEDDPYAGIEGQTAMLGLPQLFGMITKGGFSKQAIKKALIKDQILGQIGKKTKPFIKRKIREKLGEKFGGTGKFKTIATGTKDYGPHTKTKTKTKVITQPSPHGGGGGSKGTHSTQGGGGGGHKAPGGGGYGPHSGGRNPWGRADGGLINFYRYGGFSG